MSTRDVHLVFCPATCWSCKFGECFDPPQRHPWWDADDVDAAKAADAAPPKGDCGCPCAHPETP